LILSVPDEAAANEGMLDLEAGDTVHFMAPNFPTEGLGGIPKSAFHDNTLTVTTAGEIFGPVELLGLETGVTATSTAPGSDEQERGMRVSHTVSTFPATPSAGLDFLFFSHVDTRRGNIASRLAFRTLQGVDGLDISATDSQIIVEQPVEGTTEVDGSTTVTGENTRFSEQVGVGQILKVSGTAGFARVLAVNSDTELIVDTAIGDGASQTINVAAETGAKLSLPTMDGGSY
jgi:hypothetical protein